jgi:3-oxoacyl-(acyl-carrier-protein) synthase
VEEYVDGDSHDVAIIGMACRFPDADTPAQFWSNLIDGRESITVADADADGWVRASATLDGIDRFDAGFFGYSPREAALLDPQHRLFLEVCWEALEDGGAAGARRTPEVGVYGGCGTSLYLMHNLTGEASKPLPNFLDSAHDLQLTMAAERDFLASRVSYKLDLYGPSVSLQAACATSLYALHLACQALLAGECDLALAGGAHVPVPQIDSYRPEPGLVLSADGHCRAFDARATGTVFGSGVGAVLLKPLDRALADRDRVYAVIRGQAGFQLAEHRRPGRGDPPGARRGRHRAGVHLVRRGTRHRDADRRPDRDRSADRRLRRGRSALLRARLRQDQHRSSELGGRHRRADQDVARALAPAVARLAALRGAQPADRLRRLAVLRAGRDD